MSSTSFRINPDDLIVSINAGHDGSVVALRNGNLLFSSEAEHDSRPRHSAVYSYHLLDALGKLDAAPAVIATNGWGDMLFQSAQTTYEGISDDLVHVRRANVMGRETLLFESTHERSHIFCSYGMSPFPQGQPCYMLIWEGYLGSFYEIDEKLHITEHGPVLPSPGYKYSFLYDLADPSCEMATWKLDTAGKLMALAGFAKRQVASPDEEAIITRILKEVVPPRTDKQAFSNTPFFNCGLTSPEFQTLVAVFSNTLFELFYRHAEANLKKGYPLLIGGGCGLNCEWNSKWRDSGLFSDVFVPPVANDSGSAIGTAIEAQFILSGSAKIAWRVYSGFDFVSDAPAPPGFTERPLDNDDVAAFLAEGKVIAWVQGRTEIGPRALGNRSLLAPPFEQSTRDRLNRIKQREWYRPIAPVCLEEDASRLFALKGSSPYMLFFQPSCAKRLRATTHVDGSARVQTVTRDQNEALYALLHAFKKRTGVGVLCNTSLNRSGKGFINRSSDLFRFALEKKLDGVVINSKFYIRATN